MLNISSSERSFIPSYIFISTLIILSGIVAVARGFPSTNMDVTVDETGNFDEDYPSDTHNGAVKAFSQLIADDSRNSSRSSNNSDETDSYGDDTDETSRQDENKRSESSLESDDHSSDDSSDSQYLIEELYYAYSYDEAVGDNENEDFADSKDE